MSDHTGEIVALQAQHSAELESRPYPSTIPCPPPDEMETAKVQARAKEARIYLHARTLKEEVDRLVLYLEGRINGVEVDIAQLQPVPPRMEAIEKKLDIVIEQQGDMLKAIHALSGDVGVVASTMSDYGTALEKLRAQHARNHPLKLSVVPPEQSEGGE